jgi:dolichol-phosphate mannosyltransferase
MSRVLLSYFASRYVQFITGLPIHDTTAGFKCYRRRVLETIQLNKIRFVGYAFQIEMKFLAWKYGFQITEVPIIFTDRTKGQSKMSKGIFREAIIGVIQMKVSSFFKRFPNHRNLVDERQRTITQKSTLSEQKH